MSARMKGLTVGAAVVIAAALFVSGYFLMPRDKGGDTVGSRPEAAGTGEEAAAVTKEGTTGTLELTQEEKLWGMSKEELIKKFYTYDEEYYKKVDPNRIQQTRPLEPGEKRPNLKVVKGGFQINLVGKEAPSPIEVRVPPNMPCTFHAQDMGYFKETGKNCVTVKADEKGVARVHYVSPGGPGGSLIVAHSPEASGWAKIQVMTVREEEYERLRKEQPKLFTGKDGKAVKELELSISAKEMGGESDE